MRENYGFTLVEVLVSSVIFALVIVGLLSVFSSSRKHSVHVRERISGVELGKFFIDPLHMDVRQDTWDANGLDVSAVVVPFGTQKINNRDFTATYVVADGNPASANYDVALVGTDLRRVTTTIIWTEPSP